MSYSREETEGLTSGRWDKKKVALVRKAWDLLCKKLLHFIQFYFNPRECQIKVFSGPLLGKTFGSEILSLTICISYLNIFEGESFPLLSATSGIKYHPPGWEHNIHNSQNCQIGPFYYF